MLDAGLRRCALAAFVATLSFHGSDARAEISGFVRELGSGTPIAGARVHLQAQPDPFVFSAADGSFTLPTSTDGVVTAAVTYDASAPANWTTGGGFANDGSTGVEILLRPLPAGDVANYQPSTSTLCSVCHNPQVQAWETSSHARAGGNEWVLDVYSGTGTPGGGNGYVFRDTHDADDTGFCAACHTPLADAQDPGNVFLNEVTDPAALEGVSCLGCHQISDVDGDINGLNHLGNSTYRFPDDPGGTSPEFWVWGPLDDVNFSAMQAMHAPVFNESRFCASCHQYVNPFTGAPGQSTYDEWLSSPFAQAGEGFRSCQDCHMPSSSEPGEACTVQGLERPGDQIHEHSFVGSTPATLADAMELSVVTEQQGDQLRVTAQVTNAGAGHAFPTGVSVRNGILVVAATLGGTDLVQVEGPTIPFWGDDGNGVPEPGPGGSHAGDSGDLAGFPGKGYARVLEGRINGQGAVERPVLFIDAEAVFADTRLLSGETDTVEVVFQLPATRGAGAVVDIESRLLYRRAWRKTYVNKGWVETPGGMPVEIEVARDEQSVTLGGVDIIEVPTLDRLSAALFVLLLIGLGTFWLRRFGA